MKDQKNLRLASKTIKNFVDLYEFQKYKLGPPRREEEREEEEEEDNNDRKPLIKKDKSKVPKNKKRKPVPPPKPSHFLKKFQKNETILEWLMFFLFILQVALIPLHLEKKILDNWFLSFIPTYLILVLMIIYSIFFNKYRMKLRKYNNDELIFLGLLSNTSNLYL